MKNTAGSLTYDTKLDSSGFENGLGKLGRVTGTVAKSITVALAAATTAVTALVSASVKSFAEYEQLAGGTKLLFGDAADYIMAKSEEAYKNVQMSQNEYLKQVNGFAVGLKESMGGNIQAAAELADKIITAEADIVAATGNTQEAVQNAFNGIMKGNYVMLDNLQLGIKPTQAGMQEVIDKVNEWNAAQGRLTEYQLGNLADMQSALVDYVEMQGLAGYAQMEASETISGSLGSLKGAWNDFITDLGKDNADIRKSFDKVVESAKKFGKNIVPIIGNIIQSITVGIRDIFPEVIESIPTLVNEYLPLLVETGATLLNALVEGISNNGQVTVDGIISVTMTIVNTILENLPKIQEMGMQVIVYLTKGLAQQLPTLIPQIVNTVILMGETLIDNTDELVDAGILLMEGLSEGLLGATPQLIDKIPVIIDKLLMALTDNLPRLIAMGMEFDLKLAFGLIKAIPQLVSKAPEIIVSLVKGIGNLGWKLVEAGKDLLIKLKDGIIDKISDLWDVGKRMVEGIWEGISNGYEWITNKIKGWVGNLMDFFKKILGISSPSKVMRDQIGQWIPKGIAVGIDANTDSALESIDKMNDDIVNKMQNAAYLENAKFGYSGFNGSVSEILNANSVIRVENYNTLELDGEKVYENQQVTTKNKNLQKGFGGAIVSDFTE